MTTKQKPNRNKRKLMRAQITPEQQAKLLALEANHPDGLTYGVIASQILINQLIEIAK